MFSEVHFAMTVDISQLRAVGLLEERLGVRSSEVPALVGNQLDTVNRATGGEPRKPGSSEGQPRHICPYRTDIFLSRAFPDVRNIRGRSAACLAERTQYFSLKTVGRTPPSECCAAPTGRGRPLKQSFPPGLESRRDWNSRPGGERVSLQYSQSHMLVRYITESYGVAAPLRMANG